MGARPVPPSPGEWPGLSGTGRVGRVSSPEGQWLGLPGVRGQRQGRAWRGAEPRGTPLPHFLKGSSSCWSRWPCSGGWVPRTRSGACGQAPRVGPPGGHGPLGAARAPAVSPPPPPALLVLPAPPSLLRCSVPSSCSPSPPSLPSLSTAEVPTPEGTEANAGSSNRRRHRTAGPGVASAWPHRERGPSGWDTSGE